MDEDFEFFLSEMGAPIGSRIAPAAVVDAYRGRLPAQLLSYWEEFGWGGYGDGLFWTVNPQEYEPALDAWIGETPYMERDAYHVIARTAFGDLFLFGERTGCNLRVVATDAMVMQSKPARADLDMHVRAFFSSRSPDGCDFTGADGRQLFGLARKRLGQLQHDEMYGFVPALALGGPATLDHLQKVKAVEHLVLLAQLAPLKVMDASR